MADMADSIMSVEEVIVVGLDVHVDVWCVAGSEMKIFLSGEIETVTQGFQAQEKMAAYQCLFGDQLASEMQQYDNKTVLRLPWNTGQFQAVRKWKRGRRWESGGDQYDKEKSRK
jgi:hypothetical protein